MEKEKKIFFLVKVYKVIWEKFSSWKIWNFCVEIVCYYKYLFWIKFFFSYVVIFNWFIFRCSVDKWQCVWRQLEKCIVKNWSAWIGILEGFRETKKQWNIEMRITKGNIKLILNRFLHLGPTKNFIFKNIKTQDINQIFQHCFFY